MSTFDDADPDLVAVLGDAALSRGTRRNRLALFGAYARWCRDAGLRPLPACPEQLRLYLHETGRGWSASHRRNVGLSVAWVHLRTGSADPRDAQYFRYLHAAARAWGQRRKEAAHPLSALEISRMVRAATEPSPQDQLQQARGAVIRAAACNGFAWQRPGRPWTRLLAVPHDAFTVTAHEVRLTSGAAGTLAITEGADPLGFRALVNVLAVRTGCTRPLELDGDEQVALVSLWKRIGRMLGEPEVPGSDTLARWDDGRWWWHQRLVVPYAERALRDVAWVLLAWSQGKRFADVHDARLVSSSDQEWTLVTAAHKSSPDGAEPLRMTVRHLSECSALCPACALADHVELQELLGRSTPWLFATRYGGEARRMTAANGRLVLQGMWEAAGQDPEVTVCTRSLRAGAAVEAAESGADISDICELLGHAEERTVWHYLRKLRPEVVEVHIEY